MSWIKLAEDKPPVGQAVVVYLEGRGPLIAVRLYAYKAPEITWMAIFSTGCHPIDKPSLITHWQILKSPQEEADEDQATVVYPLSDFQREELRTAFRYARPYCPHGLEIHKIGFTDRSLLLMEVQYDGHFKTLSIPRDGEASVVGEVLFPIRKN
jgi:hypothetical protein